jgi:hypothetical protein
MIYGTFHHVSHQDYVVTYMSACMIKVPSLFLGGQDRAVFDQKLLFSAKDQKKSLFFFPDH